MKNVLILFFVYFIEAGIRDRSPTASPEPFDDDDHDVHGNFFLKKNGIVFFT